MVALKLPECEFKGLLNFVQERIKHLCPCLTFSAATSCLDAKISLVLSINSYYLQPNRHLQHTSKATKPQRYNMLRPLTCELFFQNSLRMGSLGSKSIKSNVTKPTTLFKRILCHPKFVIINLVPRSLVLHNRHHVPCIITSSIIPFLSILNV